MSTDQPARPALPDDRVSRNKKITDPDNWKATGLARIEESGNVIACSCGWAKVHPRERVRGDSAERHVKKRHGGRSIWM